ncbi:sel1 repeat family protein [Bacillus safensis]|nr:sel1 repeat family protein [Bacillus safensis]
MKQFEILTKYIPKLQEDHIGEWVIDQENDGTAERPIQMPFVNYSETVQRFIEDVYTFAEQHQEMELTRYSEILSENGIEWGTNDMEHVDISNLNAQCVLALIMGALRAERFSEGAIFNFFKSGAILKWLERLKNLDV